MRNGVKNKAMSPLAITGLLVASLCLPPAAFAKDSCDSAKINPYANSRAKYGEFCKTGDPACKSQMDGFSEIAKQYLKDIQSACAANTAALNVERPADTQQFERAKGLYQEAADGNRKLSDIAVKRARQAGKLLEENYKKLPAQASGPAPAATSAHSREMQTLKTKIGTPREVITESDVSTPPVQHKVGSFKFGSELRKVLLEAKDEFDDSAGKFEDLKKKLEAPNNPDNPTSPDDKKKTGGLLDSFNPNTLMGLATAGMGLAAAMKKPDASGVSTPSDTTPPPAGVAATGFGEAGKATSQSPNMSNASTKTDLPAAGSGGSPGFYGAPISPDSEVTSRGGLFTGSGGTSAAMPSGSAGLDGFGAGGSSGGSSRVPADGAAKDPGAALAKVPDDFSAGGFGGGGGGGGLNFSSSSATNSDSFHTEDPLKETLQDMAAAVDNGNGSTDTSLDGAQADATDPDFSSNNEFLFTRVRSAIQRSLKKGAVISGLSAKIR
jgi:hypothetical protein